MKNSVASQQTGAIEQEGDSTLLSLGSGQLIKIILFGFIVGVIVWGLTTLLDMYLFRAIACQGNATMQCATSLSYAEITATLLGGIIGLLGLIRFQMFRPLLVVLGAIISLWGIVTAFIALPWYGVMLITAAAYALAYGLFAWVARIRLFWIVALISLLIIVGVRLAVNS
jgi:hypothetical protein